MLRSSNCVRPYRCSEFHLALERKRSLLASVFCEKLETRPGHCFLMHLEAGFDFPSVTNRMTSLQYLSQWLTIGADLIRKELSALNRECQFAKLSKFTFLKRCTVQHIFMFQFEERLFWFFFCQSPGLQSAFAVTCRVGCQVCARLLSSVSVTT